MISLTIKLRSKKLMEEWIEDMSDNQVFPVPVTYREEDSLDNPRGRYVLTSKLEDEQRQRSKA